MKKYLIGFIVGVIVSVPSLALASTHDFTIKSVRHEASGYVSRWDDPDYKVKCWQSSDYNRGGISCIPWDEIKTR